MRRPLAAVVFFCLQASFAQLTFPSAPYLPPNASHGAISSSSSPIPNSQWSTLLGNLIYFYDAQRSGNLSSQNRVTWRNSSALSDGNDVSMDLTGGYYDAGDYIKATYPLAFALTSICWGAISFGQGYDLSNQTAYLDSMLRWGLDWLVKAHPSNDTLFVLIGDTNTDNAYWGGDQNIPEPRVSYQINSTNPGTDAAAGTSAAFSACSALYAQRGFQMSKSSPASLGNNTYADQLLQHAQELYGFALNASGGRTVYQDSVPAVADAYASSSFEDELTLAALLLSFASNSSSLYQQAESFYSQFSLGNQNGVFNWDSKIPALPVLFTQIAPSVSGANQNISVWQKESERYFDNILNGGGPGYMTKGGLLFYPGDSDEASLNPALNAALLMYQYFPFASDTSKASTYLQFADAQLEYALGNNPMSAPYVVGSNPNSPQNPHSALASGGNDISRIDTSPPQEAYVLYGAVVGGPDPSDRFYDIRSDWPETEPALDINSPMLSLAAWHVMNDSNDPFFTSLQAGEFQKRKPSGQPCDAAFPCNHTLSKGGKIAIAVVVTIVGLGLVCSILYWTFIHIKQTKTL